MEKEKKDWGETALLLEGVSLEGVSYSVDQILLEFSEGLQNLEEAAQGVEENPFLSETEQWEQLTAEPDLAETQAIEANTAQTETLDETACVVEAPEMKEEEQASASLYETSTLEELIAQTVDSVLGDEAPPKPRPWEKIVLLFTQLTAKREAKQEETEEAPQPIEEPSYQEMFFRWRTACKRMKRAISLSAICTALLFILTVLDTNFWLPSIWHTNTYLQGGGLFLLLLLACLPSRPIFQQAWRGLRQKTIGYEMAVSLLCLSTLADCALVALHPVRTVGLPLVASAGLCVTVTLWGRREQLLAQRDNLKMAIHCGEYGDAISVGADGITHGYHSTSGFYQRLTMTDAPTHWQELLFPSITGASLLFALLATLRQGDWSLFCWNWSVILTASVLLPLPLCYGLAFHRLSRRLARTGTAVAGYYAMEQMGQEERMILNDNDLFPQGTVILSTLKTFGEEIGKVASYAAGLAKVMGGGIDGLFDGILEADGSVPAHVEAAETHDGGIRGMIHGETVLLGTASWLRTMGIALPKKTTQWTGLFLAVDGEVVAMFAIQYQTSETGLWAMRALERERMVPVLAVRDGNLTPNLLKKLFETSVKMDYPPLEERLRLASLSAKEPCVLLCRDGLMPYAEAVLGVRRCGKTVRSLSVCMLLGSVLSVLLGFYLTFVGAWSSLNPLTLLLYQVLWLLPTLFCVGWVERY